MNIANNDIINLRFEGNEINPEKVKPSEICDIIIELQNVLSSVIKDRNPGVDTNQVLFSFDSIRNESLGIYFKDQSEKLIEGVRGLAVSSFLIITTSISNNDYSKLPTAAVSSLKKIGSFSKRYDCNANFNYNGATLSRITPTTEIKETKAYTVKSSVKIYGEVVEAGANVHIRLNDGSIVLVDTDKTNSKRLASYLWEVVGLVGNAKWDIETFKISSFKLTEILEYNPKGLSEGLKKVRLTESGWDRFTNDDQINKQLFK